MLTGRCLCGAIQYVCGDEPRLVVHCHCESCRRHTSSPMTTFLVVPAPALRFTKGQAKEFASSPDVRRGFCGDCGSPLYYRVADRPDDVDLYACTLTDPAGLAPQWHVHSAEQLPWLEVLDHLPRFPAGSRGEPPLRHGPRRDS